MRRLARQSLPPVGSIFVLCAALVACTGRGQLSATFPAQPAPLQTIQHTLSPAVNRTATSTLSPTLPPSLTPSPDLTLTPAVPTPSLPEGLSADVIIFGAKTPECLLPCWRGLNINQSTSEEIQAAFDDLFEFSASAYSTPAFVADATYEDATLYHEWKSPGQSPYGSFIFSAAINEDTDRLQALIFNWVLADEFAQNMSIQRVIRELGRPSQLLVELERGGQGLSYGARLTALLVYDNGVAFDVLDDLPITTVVQDNQPTETTTLCLDRPFSGTMWIGHPLSDDPSERPLRGQWITRELSTLTPIQDVFHVDLEEITEMALQEAHPCLSTDDF